MSEALACLAEPELAAVWTRGAATEVWRERAFEVVLDGAWITGVFDRVVVERDVAGRARRAAVFDFKTDRIGGSATDLAGAVGRHRPQLEIYRRVVAVLTGLAMEAVTAEVVFTGVRRKAAVGPRAGAN